MFVDVESQGSEHCNQSNDPPPEFIGTKPSEFKSYRKKMRLWILFTRNSSSVTRATCLEQADRSSIRCL